MVKSFIPAIRSYPFFIVSLAKSRWIPFLFLIPVALYVVFLSFDKELTDLIIPFFPEEPDKSFGFYNDFLRLCFNEMLWLSFFLLTAWSILVHGRLFQAIIRAENHVLAKSTWYVTAIVFLSLAGALLISYATLKTFPNSADEYAYLYQAETLSQGKLAQQAHPLENFFHFAHIAQKEGLSVGRFPPGWPLLLSLPFIFDFPAFWLNPLLGAVALLTFYSFTKKYYGPRVAMWSLVSLAFTGYYIFNSASFFSHTSCLLFTVGFVYCLYLTEEKRSPSYALLAGMFLGMVVITRYYTAVLIFFPVLVSLIYSLRWRALGKLFLIGLGSLPFFLFLFWYNYKITGNGLLPVTVWADPEETLGFVKGHTFLKGIEHLVRRVLLFLYWCSPALFVLYFVYLFRKVTDKIQRFIKPEDYFLVLLLIGYFFYHHIGGNQYGPRFAFEGLPFLIVFVVSKIFQTRSKWSLALLAAGMLYGMIKLPYIMQREHQVVEERMDVYVLAEKEKIDNAVILISTPTSVIRPMPIRDLTRNGLDYEGRIIYAEDQHDKNHQLMEFYPERAFYKYIRDPEKVEGRLVILR